MTDLLRAIELLDRLYTNAYESGNKEYAQTLKVFLNELLVCQSNCFKRQFPYK